MPLPLHKSADITDCGVLLRTVSADHPHGPVSYAHRDDYYIFGLIEDGRCTGSIDFAEREFSARSVLCIRPWQVHAFVRMDDLKADMILMDESLLTEANRLVIDEYALFTPPCTAGEREFSQLSRLYALLSEYMPESMPGPRDEIERETVYGLARAIAAITVGIVARTCGTRESSPRKTELTLAFRRLLQRDLHIHRTPSHYASELNISTVYLNEAVRGVTGVSAGRYIRNEIVLRAKRQLVHTGRSIREIAYDLGFDDFAYFSRLFSSVAGMSPSEFRARSSQRR